MPACYADILLRETSLLRCWYAMPASRQAALSKRAYTAEIFDPFSEEFINWLFQHFHKVCKEICSKDYFNSVLEPECIKKLCSDMFQISERQTDELPYETATVKLMWE